MGELSNGAYAAKPGIAMQVRCIYCRREQYALNVISVSYSKGGCSWCGKTPPVMTEEEYRAELTKDRRADSV